MIIFLLRMNNYQQNQSIEQATSYEKTLNLYNNYGQPTSHVQQIYQQYYQQQYYQQQYYHQYYCSNLGIYQHDYNQYQQYPQQYNPYQQMIEQNEQPHTKLSRNQKRKKKLKEKMQEKLELSKFNSFEKCEQSITKNVKQQSQLIPKQQTKVEEKRRPKLGHLVEIGKEIYKLRKKLGQLKAESTKAKLAKKLKIGQHKKKPSVIKRMNEKYERMKQNSKISVINEKKEQQAESQWENQQEPKLTKEQSVDIIRYPPAGKLIDTLYNNIVLRQWVDHFPSQTLEEKVLIFINRLAYQQAVKQTKQPLKYKKRIVAGFNECLRTVNTQQPHRKSKLLIVALNIIFNPLKMSCDSRTIQIIENAKKENIPVLHVSTRAKLGRAFIGKFGPRLSVVSVINYEGSVEMYQQIIDEWRELQEKYKEI